MTAEAIISDVQKVGGKLLLGRDGSLRLRGIGDTPKRFIDLLREHKQAIIEILSVREGQASSLVRLKHQEDGSEREQRQTSTDSSTDQANVKNRDAGGNVPKVFSSAMTDGPSGKALVTIYEDDTWEIDFRQSVSMRHEIRGAGILSSHNH